MSSVPISAVTASTDATAKTEKAANPEVAAFFAALEPKDRLIHELAAQMLKTRYTPQRSNKWAEWKKAQQTAGSSSEVSV